MSDSEFEKHRILRLTEIAELAHRFGSVGRRLPASILHSDHIVDSTLMNSIKLTPQLPTIESVKKLNTEYGL